MINFTIPGQPQGKGRARAFVRHGNVAHYTPAKTRSYEGVITTLAMEAMRGSAPSDQPLALELDMCFEIPRSWPLWKAQAARQGKVVPTTKPDADNVAKAVKDACNGVVWRDDCQVVTVMIRKRYSDSPCVAVSVSVLSDLMPAQTKTKIRP